MLNQELFKEEKYKNKKRERLIKILSNALKNIANDKDLGLDYILICACALELLESVLGIKYDFPVDIDKIAHELGIDVVYQPLNGKMGRQDGRAHKVVGRNLKIMNPITGNKNNCILIDDESRYDAQRYAFAHELAHYMIHEEEKNYNSEYCVMPMLFKKMEEMVADIFAIFLLIPLPIFLKEFVEYLGDQSVPVRTSEWLKYLSIVAEVPYEEVAIGYQNIRYVCGSLYASIYNDSMNESRTGKIDVSLQKQIEKMKQMLTADVIEKLFC
ncbi:MAG: ImmA/IrrE family metallo-endopeptidase [Lachnospiraceae bacterium]|nr:ImmA/IrrE family metallo-endopeptidase [Lachnospiraceae bacterium]